MGTYNDHTKEVSKETLMHSHNIRYLVTNNSNVDPSLTTNPTQHVHT